MLYSRSRDQKMDYQDALAHYRKSVQQTFDMYLFTLRYFLQIAAYAEQDLEKKRAKLLPSEDDKAFTTKLFQNALVQSLVANKALQELLDKDTFKKGIDEDNIRKLYSDFAQGDAYQTYLKQEKSNRKDHIEILLQLFKHCINSESFTDAIEDLFPQWVDDQSLIIGTMKKTIKALPEEDHFFEAYRPQPETTIEFGEVLLKKVETENDELSAVIEPTLKNWDPERVAVIDMILLKMAVCELLTFPTIPAKVTLNEFVEISKLYSTDKSKDFINGILDRLMKKLEKEGKIHKKGRGLQD